ncbi:MAG: MerR family transcriptional regulator [Myxococcota bacterium]
MTRRDRRAALTIGAVASATGIPIPTLRSWEQRYGAPFSDRRPSGHRLYSLAEVERLRLVAHLLRRGHRAGQVVPADHATLERLTASSAPASAEQALRGLDAPGLLQALIHATRGVPVARLVKAWRKKLPLARAKRDPIRAALLDQARAMALALLARPVRDDAPQVIVGCGLGEKTLGALLVLELEELGCRALAVDAAALVGPSRPRRAVIVEASAGMTAAQIAGMVERPPAPIAKKPRRPR